MTGIERIAAERKRQIEQEGWTAEHDDEHVNGEMALAAVCFASPVRLYEVCREEGSIKFYDPWPQEWSPEWDRRLDDSMYPLPDPSEHTPEQRLDLLTKAGALIAAEIDRLLRIKAP